MTPFKDPYEQFAPFYDDWQALFPRPFSLAMTLRMKQALDEYGTPEKSLVDLACGTGTLACWWARRHKSWDVWGVDRSRFMIDRANECAESQRPSPTFLVQDLTQLDLPRRFGMATSFFDSINHITRTRDLQKIFKKAHDVLLEDGLFIFDTIDEDSFEEIFATPSITENDQLYVGMECGCYEQRGVTMGLARFSIFSKADEPGGWDRHVSEIHERCWRREQIEPMIEASGLELIHVQLIDPEEQEDVFVSRRLYVCRR